MVGFFKPIAPIGPPVEFNSNYQNKGFKNQQSFKKKLNLWLLSRSIYHWSRNKIIVKLTIFDRGLSRKWFMNFNSTAGWVLKYKICNILNGFVRRILFIDLNAKNAFKFMKKRGFKTFLYKLYWRPHTFWKSNLDKIF